MTVRLKMPTMSHEQCATTLAALRFWQQHLENGGEVPKHFDHFDDTNPLTVPEIDQLCESINLHEEATATTDPNAPALTLPINLRITYKDIASLLCSAFEGGSNYWYSIVDQQAPKTFTFKSWEPIGENVAFEDIQVFPHIDYPLNEGGYLMIKDNEDTDEHPEPFKLSLPEIERGLATLALKHPNAMAAILSENADAGTGDIFLQCCLFGEVIYG